MDAFVRLVPMDGGEDAGDDEDAALVYGEDDCASRSEAAEVSSLSSASPPSPHDDALDDRALVAASEVDQMRYCRYVALFEGAMRARQRELQRRVDAMQRVLRIDDTRQQMDAYMQLLAMRVSEPPLSRDPSADVVPRLLECASALRDEGDVETALMGAFAFLGDARPAERPRVVEPLLAAVLAASRGDSDQPVSC